MTTLVPGLPPASAREDVVEAPKDSVSQTRLVWRRFAAHRMAVVGLVGLAALYFVAIFAGFFAPMTADNYDADHAYAPPQIPRVSADGIWVRDYEQTVNLETLETEYTTGDGKIEMGFFVHGERYSVLGLFETDIHFFGAKNADQRVYLLGADGQGRDMLSRLIHASRISLSVGLVGVAFSLVLGMLIGGASGYFGGRADAIIQRLIELIMSVPTLPLWLGLSAAVPPYWSPVKVYFAITIVLSLIGWTGVARVIRGQFLQIRHEDFVLAARLDGCSPRRIILRHMLPLSASYVIASLTIAIPAMILAETALSFLGLGLRDPAVSWGVLLQNAQSLQVLSSAPWLLAPAAAVILAVVCLSFVGDGLRDAADPYGR